MDLPPVPAPDADARRAAVARHAELAVPAGALGRLAELGVWLAAAQGSCPPRPPAQPRVVVFAGDHGIAAAGVSAHPPTRTLREVAAVREHTAPVTVLAPLAGASVRVVDVALDTDPPTGPARGTGCAAAAAASTGPTRSPSPGAPDNQCLAHPGRGVQRLLLLFPPRVVQRRDAGRSPRGDHAHHRLGARSRPRPERLGGRGGPSTTGGASTRGALRPVRQRGERQDPARRISRLRARPVRLRARGRFRRACRAELVRDRGGRRQRLLRGPGPGCLGNVPFYANAGALPGGLVASRPLRPYTGAAGDFTARSPP